MGELRSKFNEHISGNISREQLEENAESDNYIGRFSQFDPSGGRLIPGENLINNDGVATVNQQMSFQISIRPKEIQNAQPLRLEVDNCHRAGINKIIHINPASGAMVQIPNNLVEQISPDYAIDLVAISGSQPFRDAIRRSVSHWEETD